LAKRPPRVYSVDRLFVDTNVLIRYLTNDDPAKAERVEKILKRTIAGKAKLVMNNMVIAELVWTLESYYGLSKTDIAEKLAILLNTPNLEVSDRQRILKALGLYVEPV
jgi:predicted nucleic-acid-binding protein